MGRFAVLEGFWYINGYMAAVQKTIDNPYGLTYKQQIVINDIITDVQNGKPVKPVKSHALAYDTENKKVLATMTTENMNRQNFRQALLEGMAKLKIIGEKSKIARRLNEGLNATVSTKEGSKTDYRTRLAYIQEVNKITGVYASEKKESKHLKINVDMSYEELQDKINRLHGELTPA